VPTNAPIDKKASRPEPLESSRRIIAVVDKGSCTGCGICVDACLEQAILVDTIAAVDPGRCTGCGACIAECPNEALSLPRPVLATVGGISG
jgi:ferredoxin